MTTTTTTTDTDVIAAIAASTARTISRCLSRCRRRHGGAITIRVYKNAGAKLWYLDGHLNALIPYGGDFDKAHRAALTGVLLRLSAADAAAAIIGMCPPGRSAKEQNELAKVFAGLPPDRAGALLGKLPQWLVKFRLRALG